MKMFLPLVFLLAFATVPAWSQTCSVPVLRTQADVDNFSTAYPGCTVINSDLEISSPTITNLDGLRNVTRVTRSLKITQNPNLTNIAGLSSLTIVDIRLSINNNDNLLTLEGLDHLTSTKNIDVFNNKKLTSISSLSGLNRIFGGLTIASNPALTTLQGLQNISFIGGLDLRKNDNLLNLNGLRRLRQIGETMHIGNNNSLKNLKGLERLETLTSQSSGYIEITGNKALTSISEIGQMESRVPIRITNNPLLSDCAIKIVCSSIPFANATISGNAAGCASTEEVRTSQVCTPQTLVRINAGGQAFTTATQKLFVADQYYAGIDRTSSIASGDILNTTNDVIYRSARSASSFSYNIPVVNELVNVTLHFAETYFGVPGTKGEKGGPGSRQFNVNIEGGRKLTNYDIFAEAGGALRAVQLTIPVSVTDGMLNIDFLTGAADLPRISAIEVTATPTLIPIEDGMVNGGLYKSNNYANSDHLYIRQVPSGGDYANLTWRSYFKFQLPAGKAAITSAKLRVYGHNDDVYDNNPDNTQNTEIHAYGVNNDSWTEKAITGTNAPAASTASLGSVGVNDVLKYYEIDVTSYVNAQRQSGDQTVSLMLDNPANQSTAVTFSSKEGGFYPPQLIYQTTKIVQPTNMTARIGQEEVFPEAQKRQQSTVYPNPIQDQFTVSVSPEHTGPITFEMINTAGKSHFIPAPQNAKPGENTKINIAGESFNTGIYSLKVKSDAFTEVIRILIAE
ncbi:CBM96 family carbohydrate-binding protein [Dyadobacter sandarakinus]|uniref:DNRLRE domain-containing protein n=1 Tax=Dyadobacter sandarakinus TaxID=2747268 RepID=A0ABX7I7B0_9BACT|nr:malectin domain-containing carbohydrate-binding protein [Dyadobacter sandarakinus]QRR01432.1 DNRLRE domain-containing protein [Dyadobacter sandarakinus]